LTVTSFLFGCDNSELTTKIDSLEKSNQELTVLNEKLSTTLKDSVLSYQLVVDELTTQNDSIKYYKSVLDSLTRIPKKPARKPTNSKCDFGALLLNALSAADKFHKGSLSFSSASAPYTKAYKSLKQVKNSISQTDLEDIQEIMVSIEGILERGNDYLTGEERMSLQLWMELSRLKCERIKERLCQ